MVSSLFLCNGCFGKAALLKIIVALSGPFIKLYMLLFDDEKPIFSIKLDLNLLRIEPRILDSVINVCLQSHGVDLLMHFSKI